VTRIFTTVSTRLPFEQLFAHRHMLLATKLAEDPCLLEEDLALARRRTPLSLLFHLPIRVSEAVPTKYSLSWFYSPPDGDRRSAIFDEVARTVNNLPSLRVTRRSCLGTYCIKSGQPRGSVFASVTFTGFLTASKMADGLIDRLIA
jgi:hypothetical protein